MLRILWAPSSCAHILNELIEPVPLPRGGLFSFGIAFYASPIRT